MTPNMTPNCTVCDVTLPANRQDYLCEECRRRRIVDHRDTRPRIRPNELVVEFSTRKAA
jgi:DNA-directed RNA polymerase subunit RPC12/RpoP